MDRTNITDKGYTFNGQNYVNQTKVNSQGNNYTVALPSTISASSLAQPQATLPVTQPQYNTNAQQAQATQAGAYTTGASQTADQNVAQQQEVLKASQNDYSNLLTQAGGKGTDTATQYNQQDATGNSVNSLAGKLRSLNAQSMALGLDNQAKTQREINNATGQNITQSAVTRNTADATRENLINQASIAMQSAIVNADYQTAKSYADQMVDAKYDQLEANTKAKLFNLENIKDNLTSAEKKVAEATTARLLQEERNINDKKETEKGIRDIGLTLSKYGVSQKVISDVLASKDIEEAISKAGANLQDPKAKLELQNMKLEMSLKTLEMQKVSRAISLMGQKTPAQSKAELASMKNAKAAVPVLEDKMLLMEGILSSKAIDSVVGPSFLSRAAGGVSGIAGRFAAGAAVGGLAGLPFGGVGAIPGAIVGGTALASQGLKDVFGDRQNLISSVNQLTDKAFLDELLSLKERGGSLGQVTEKEGQALRSAASRIGTWEIKDSNGKVVGYNASEKDFKKEIDRMKASTNRILTEMRGSQYSADEQKLLEETFGETNSVDASAYFQ